MRELCCLRRCQASFGAWPSRVTLLHWERWGCLKTGGGGSRRGSLEMVEMRRTKGGILSLMEDPKPQGLEWVGKRESGHSRVLPQPPCISQSLSFPTCNLGVAGGEHEAEYGKDQALCLEHREGCYQCEPQDADNPLDSFCGRRPRMVGPVWTKVARLCPASRAVFPLWVSVAVCVCWGGRWGWLSSALGWRRLGI